MSAERGRQEMKIWAGGALRGDGGEKDENERGGRWQSEKLPWSGARGRERIPGMRRKVITAELYYFESVLTAIHLYL